MGIVLSFIAGISFFGGYILSNTLKSKKVVSVISVSLAFVVLINLILIDIFPDIMTFLISDFSFKNLIITLLFTLIGLGLLLILDRFVPHHNHEHHEVRDNLKEHNEHIEHISKISILALILHNVIECMVLCLLTKESLPKGLLMMLVICLHNIPLGLQIGSGLHKNKIGYLTILSLSGLVGGLCGIFIDSIPEIIEQSILCFTLGMLLYLLIFELSKEMYNNRNNKYSLYGIITGVIVIIIINSIAAGL